MSNANWCWISVNSETVPKQFHVAEVQPCCGASTMKITARHSMTGIRCSLCGPVSVTLPYQLGSSVHSWYVTIVLRNKRTEECSLTQPPTIRSAHHPYKLHPELMHAAHGAQDQTLALRTERPARPHLGGDGARRQGREHVDAADARHAVQGALRDHVNLRIQATRSQSEGDHRRLDMLLRRVASGDRLMSNTSSRAEMSPQCSVLCHSADANVWCTLCQEPRS